MNTFVKETNHEYSSITFFSVVLKTATGTALKSDFASTKISVNAENVTIVDQKN